MDIAHNKHVMNLAPTDDLDLLFKEQTRELLYSVFYTLLAKEGNYVNGYLPGRIDPQLKCPGSQEIYQSFLGACTEFLALHGDELRDSIDTLDMSDVKVYETFHETILLIFEEISWGRIVSAVCASKTMASKAIKDGRLSLVESLQAWLQNIFKERLQDWIGKQGGWVKFPNKFNPDRKVIVSKVVRKKADSSSLLALAAAGFGVIVVTSLLGR